MKKKNSKPSLPNRFAADNPNGFVVLKTGSSKKKKKK